MKSMTVASAAGYPALSVRRCQDGASGPSLGMQFGTGDRLHQSTGMAAQ